MSKQYNKGIKRKRRISYIRRLKARTKKSGGAATKSA